MAFRLCFVYIVGVPYGLLLESLDMLTVPPFRIVLRVLLLGLFGLLLYDGSSGVRRLIELKSLLMSVLSVRDGVSDE